MASKTGSSKLIRSKSGQPMRQELNDGILVVIITNDNTNSRQLCFVQRLFRNA